MYWLDDLLELGAIMLAAAVSMALLIGGIGSIAYTIDKKQCAAYEAVTGKDTRFAAWTCYVETESGWQAWEEYKTRAMASEGLKAEAE